MCACVCARAGVGLVFRARTVLKPKTKNQIRRDYNHGHLLVKMIVNMVERILELTTLHQIMAFQRT